MAYDPSALVSLIVPATSDGAERERNWRWLRTWYVANFPEWEIIEHTTTLDPWSKGTAVNDAVARSNGQVLIIADADLLIGARSLARALLVLEGWVVPHKLVYRLSEAATNDVLDGTRTVGQAAMRNLERPCHRGPRGGGFVVLTRAAFNLVGGMDERFTVWGGDDIAFGWALDTLVGPPIQLGYPSWHLWHPTLRPPDGRGSQANEQLAGAYRRAHGNPAAMRDLQGVQ